MKQNAECVSTSLFDYLGRAAGEKLGLEVAAAAKKANEPVLIRNVQTKTYTGPINVYRKAFLDTYFKKPAQTAVPELPF